YRLDEILPKSIEYDYVGRELRASPGEGYAVAHRREQDRVVRVALGAARLYRDASFLGPLGTARSALAAAAVNLDRLVGDLLDRQQPPGACRRARRERREHHAGFLDRIGDVQLRP